MRVAIRVTEPSRRIAELLSERGGRSYLYRFSYLSATLRAKLHGAPHASEIGYVFGTLPAQTVQTLAMGEFPAATPEDRAMSDAMGAYWVAFASGGDPGSAGGPRWPAFDKGKRAIMEFAVGGPVVREGLLDERLDWLRLLAEPEGAPAPRGAGSR